MRGGQLTFVVGERVGQDGRGQSDDRVRQLHTCAQPEQELQRPLAVLEERVGVERRRNDCKAGHGSGRQLET
jgi:hypothetical protein